ncbi:hypothetical protein N7495_002909 [Penicillium taxi]|uniref:uncharacterized protein n=1 Tax=Penicillium taxi TaxID=168475 RepID=UPI002544FC55|nr:uncharacterized protein N7495_002909 [Penicillium taxi]KAJ5902381.1 hypothetical protein N7495_002909 [Penicillium taxi]
MEVIESREQTSVGPPTGTEAAMINGEHNPFLDDSLMDDGRSSSLSEIDELSDNEPSDFEDSTKPERPLENDSEAETERIEDSPIIFASGTLLSVLGSTTLDDVDGEEQLVDDSPSKSRLASYNNGLTENLPDIGEEFGKKRKRLEAGDDTATEMGDDEPLKKRRSSIKSELSDPIDDDDTPLSPEPIEELTSIMEEELPVDNIPEPDLPAVPTKGKKGKKGKGRKKRAPEVDGEIEGGGGIAENIADDHLGEDEEPNERVEEAVDAQTAAKAEEESAKKMSAMESLATLEKEFATLRDKIYDEQIAKLDRELEMLSGPFPTHPEFLRQIECVERQRDEKLKYEETLFRYRTESQIKKSLAERAQINSTFFQNVRDVRERHSSAISKQFYDIQHDRFKTDELSPHHIIPFPTRRSQQIAHQTAYNQEVSVMAGVAKYVGFPAAPALAGARPSELQDDLEKMGIVVESQSRASAPRHSSVLLPPRGAMSAMSSNAFRTAAEEAFLEQTPWANPQHPIHQQQSQHTQLLQYSHQHRPQGQAFNPQQASSYVTPTAQKRMVDINAPNGSASTIPENNSIANSSANNTPYGTEQGPQHQNREAFLKPDYEIEHTSGLRSQSSSPLDMRKPLPHLSHNPALDTTSRIPIFSPPSPRTNVPSQVAHETRDFSQSHIQDG